MRASASRTGIVCATVIASLLAFTPVPQPAGASGTDTAAPFQRLLSAVDVARTVGGGSLRGLDQVIVVTDKSPADALIAAGLAGYLDGGGQTGRTAIVLTNPESLSADAAETLRGSDVSSGEVIVLGGEAAISSQVHDQIAKATGWSGKNTNPVQRIGGADRYETAAAVINHVRSRGGDQLPGSYRTVVVTNGEQLTDAFTAGGLSYRSGHAVILSPQDALPPSAQLAMRTLRANCAIVIGGPDALSEAVYSQSLELTGTTGCTPHRLDGDNRYDTAARAAQHVMDTNGAVSQVVIAADSHSAMAAPLTGDDRALLLTGPDELPEPTLAWLSNHLPPGASLLVLGDESTIPSDLVNQALLASAISTSLPSPSSPSSPSSPPSSGGANNAEPSNPNPPAADLANSMQMKVVIPANADPVDLRLRGIVDVTIDWGSNAPANCPTTAASAGNISCTYTTPGTYTIAIGRGAGNGPWLTQYGDGDNSYDGNEYLTEVISFGDLGITSLSGAFYEAVNLTALPATLPMNVTDLSMMLLYADAFNQDLSGWDTSGVTNMSAMLKGSTVFNGNVSTWVTDQVTDMSEMFDAASSFNQNISGWNVSNVSNMSRMFHNAGAFNRDLSGWCLPLIDTKPTDFDTAASSWTLPSSRPNWSCHSMQMTVAIPAGGATMALPLRGTVNVIIDWGVGAPAACPTTATTAGLRSCTYTTAGTYTITIGRGPGAGPWLTQYGDWDTKVTGVEHITEVVSFGDLGITRLSGAFAHGSNPVVPAHLPAGVTDLSWMFYRATTFNQPIGNWDTSNVTIVHSMFRLAEAFNQPIGNWDTSNVTNMTFMFLGASAFNQDISGWDTSNVTSMQGIFAAAHAFNQPIGNWDVGEVTTFASAFNDARAFNQPLSTWSTSNATDMGSMFQGATAFNQDLSGWCVPNVAAPDPWVTGSYLFNLNTPAWTLPKPVWGTCPTFRLAANGATILCPDAALGETGTVGGIVYTKRDFTHATHRITADNAATSCTSGITNFSSLTLGAGSGNKGFPNDFTADITHWDTSQATTFSRMLAGTTLFNQDISVWDTSNVTDMNSMFWQASAFNHDISTWDTSKVTWMDWMFADAVAFSQPLADWDTSSLTRISFMFLGATSFNQPLAAWDTSKVTDMSRMFSGATAFNQPIGNWNTGNVTDMREMFMGATVFDQPIGNWNTAKVTNMSRMFENAVAFNQPLSTWNTSNVTTMSRMFEGASQFNQNLNSDPGAGTWLTSKVTNMSNMFRNATQFNQNIGAWNTSSVTDMSNMFEGATVFNGAIGSWDTANVLFFSDMFFGAAAFNQNISGWVTDSVTHTNSMFYAATTFNQPIGNWNTSNVTNMTGMFQNASAFNQDIGNWNTRKVTDMGWMFQNAAQFNQDLSGWCVTNITSSPTNFDSGATSWSTTGRQPIWGCGSMQMTVVIPAGGPTMSLPLFGTVNVTIDWGVGAPAGCPTTATTAGLRSCTYTTAGTYTITIGRGTGAGPWLTTYGLSTSYVAGVELITEVITFGDLGLTAISLARGGNPALPASLPATVTSIEGMFAVSNFNRDISGWDTSNITNMGYLFSGNQVFNQDISGWDTSNVTTMSDMFQNAPAFNQNISNWDTAKVTNMTRMFRDAIAFNQDLSGWCVTLIQSEPDLFATLATAWNASSGGLPKPQWGTCPPPLGSMQLKVAIPAGGVTMALPLRGTVDVTIDWGDGAPAGCPTSRVAAASNANVNCVYTTAGSYTITIKRGPGNGPWVTQFGAGMFSYFGVEYITEVVSFGDLGITSLSGAFNTGGNPILPDSIPTRITNFSWMFSDAATFNRDIGNWDTAHATDMDYMFFRANAFDQDLRKWDTSKVATMMHMFHGATTFNQDLSGWCVPLIASEPVHFALSASAWNASPGGLAKPAWGSCPRMQLTVDIPANTAMELPLRGTVNVRINWGAGAPANCPTTANSSGNVACTYTTAGTYTITIGRGNGPSPWLTQFGRSSSEGSLSYPGMAYIAEVIRFGDLGITSLSGAFAGLANPILPADIPRTVTDLSWMFYFATNFNRDISTWNTSNVSDMTQMFRDATSFNHDLSGWCVNAVTSRSYFDERTFAWTLPKPVWGTCPQ
jgi:surface protein